MAHSPSLFALKVIVISLGLILIGAIIFVLTTIAHQAKMDPAKCPDLTIALNNTGALGNVIPQGKTFQMTLASGAETKIVTVDRCTGAKLQTITITP